MFVCQESDFLDGFIDGWMNDGQFIDSFIQMYAHLYRCTLNLPYEQDIVHEGTPINKTGMVPALCPCLAHGLVGETDTI